MIELIDGVSLSAPAEYWEMSSDFIDEITGGCGPGGLGDYMVPDTVWFLSIFFPCRIHDFGYWAGETEEDKRIEDNRFLNNMIRTVKTKTEWHLLKKLRLLRCKRYYQAVHWFGGPAFWNDKEIPG